MATLLITSAGFEGRVLKLKLGTNRLGRSPKNDFQIEDETVSAVHCEIDVVTDALIVRDCGSTNGTFVDGEPIVSATLMTGGSLRLGEVEIIAESTDVAISIPRFELRPELAPPVLFGDGSLTCPRHWHRESTYRCPHCCEVMCDECVRRMRRRGGKVHILCYKCSHPCERIGGEKKKKKSLLERLKATVILPFSRSRMKVPAGD
jgi:pSer/pThr/pTyr-binding forkhead associated (FHA) protein